MAGTYIRTEVHRQAIGERNKVKNRKYPVGWDTASRPYRIWRCMHMRCYQKTHAAQPRYKQNGITICLEWMRYRPFMEWAQASGYGAHLELDRRNNNLGYSPENCRWVTRKINARNRTKSLAGISAFGESKLIAEWVEDQRCVVSYRLLYRRVRAGWNPEIAILTPSQGRHGYRPYSARQRDGYSDPARARFKRD